MPETYDLAALNLPADSPFHRLAARCPGIVCERFGDGEYLVRRGEANQDIFLVVRGSYLVEQGDPVDGPDPARDALAVVMSNPDAPSFVGEMAYLGEGVRSASVRSAMATFALRLQPAHLDIIVEEFPFFTHVLWRQFADRLREANAGLHELQQAFNMETDQAFLEPGEVLFEAGEPAERLFQLVDGVLVFKTDGVERPLQPGDMCHGFVDPAPFFLDGAHCVSVTAKTPAILVAVERISKQAVIRNYPDLLLYCFRQAAL